MMCHRMGQLPISTIGFGRISVSSARRVPSPPASMTTFIVTTWFEGGRPNPRLRALQSVPSEHEKLLAALREAKRVGASGYVRQWHRGAGPARALPMASEG